LASKDKLISSAQKFLAKGQLPKAISEYQQLVASFPKDVRNRQKLAELLSREKRIEDALAEYEHVARHYTDTGFYLKAIAVYKQMQKLDPARVEIYRKLAELNEKQGLVGNALTEYRTLITYYEQNELQSEAVPILEKMLALDPTSLNIRAKLVEIMFATQREEEAVKFFLEVVDNLQGKQEFGKIVKLYDRFQDYLSVENAASGPIGEALLVNNQPEKAVHLFKKLLKNAPEDSQVLGSLAKAYTALEEHENARLTYRHLVRLDPENLEIREALARSCLAAGDSDKALETLEEVKEQFFRAQRLESLQELYRAIIEKQPDDSRAMSTMTTIREMVGIREDEQTESQQSAAADFSAEMVDAGNSEPITDREDASVRESAPDVRRELELDLDLDLPEDGERTASAKESPEKATSQVEPLPQQAEGDSARTSLADEGEGEADLEIELEIDLEGLESLEETASDVAGPAENEAVDATEAHGVEEPQSSGLAAEPPSGLDAEERAEQSPGLDKEAGPEKEYAGKGAVFEEDRTGGTEEPDEGPVDVITQDSEQVKADLEVEEAAAAETGEETTDFGTAGESEELEELLEVASEEEPDEFDQPVDSEKEQDLEEFEEIIEIEETEILEEVEVVEEGEADQELADTASLAAQPSVGDLDAELEDAAFYAQQGLFDDAERVLRTAIADHGELPELKEKLAELDNNRQTASEDDDSMDFSDLISELNDEELLGAADFLDTKSDEQEAQAGWTQELATELDSGDTESHYNLGIAYKEMGLHDDAVAEFNKASSDPSRQVDCLTLKAQCFLELGNYETAEKTLRQALALEKVSQEERVTLHYELGLFYRTVGRPLEALESFQGVAEYDLFFRDVGEIIKSLRKELNLDDESDDEENVRRNRDRISFV